MENGICCFSGHRIIPQAHVALLVARLDRYIPALYERGVREFRTGGARGFDTLAARAVLRFKQTHPDCILHLMLPCRDQSDIWHADERAEYARILALADRVLYPCVRALPSYHQDAPARLDPILCQ